MPTETAVADHWAKGDVYTLIVAALEKAGKTPDGLTVADLAPVDHFHARGLAATVDLADAVTVTSGHHVLDIGCGLGGPARYFAERFGCRVTGIDITPAFVEAARKLTALVGLEGRVTIDQGDGQNLPYADGTFDGAYSQHVTMNVAERPRFFAEAFRVVRAGGFFALTEHGLGPSGDPHYPVPWSEDGSGSYLIRPADTRTMLEAAGFVDITVEDTGEKYLTAYGRAIALAKDGAAPAFGTHILMGDGAEKKTRNAARNIEEHRTRPVQVLCRKPA